MDLRSLLRSVSQQSLKSCRVELDDRPLERASLFPLFDDHGRTEMVMIAPEDGGRIVLADWAPGLFARDWARRNRLRLPFADLADASTWDASRFVDLWHFDPWWELADPRYQGHGSVPALKHTNICGYDSTVSGILFDRDLTHASHVVRKSAAPRRFTPEALTAAASRRRAAHLTPPPTIMTAWQLRPFWRSM